MKTTIELAIEKGKIDRAKVLIKEDLLAKDKQAWRETKFAEYETLYKTVEVTVDAVLDEDGNEITPASTYFEFVEDAPSFEDWLSETRIVSYAVEATYDEDGMELTPYVPEITELVRPYIANEINDVMIDDELAKLDAYKDYIKTKKVEALDTITVKVADRVFDGNETARNNMLSALKVAEVTGLKETVWKLEDNSFATVTIAEIEQDLALAINEVGNVVKEYEDAKYRYR